MDGKSAKEACNDELYERYCKYAESSRAALLKATVVAETRRSIATVPPCLPRDDFEHNLNSMGEKEREQFIRRINMGYEKAFSGYCRRPAPKIS